MRNFWLILSVLWLWTCSGGGDKATGPEEPPIVINLTSLGGQAQKGPFNNGTAINVAELTNTLSPTGRNFSSAITDNTGRFAVANVQLESPYVELRANGYYFNEVSNEISSGQLTLFALSNLTGKTSLNVNILTHLEKNRMVTLMSGDNPKTFAQAKLQAQEEVLAIFDYSRADVPESELLDISQSGAANAKLLAMSAIIQGDLTVGQMSQLLANMSTDIASDGTLDDTNLRNTLIENSKNLDMEEVRSHLEAHYSSLGVSANIADFETEVYQFLKPPTAQNINASTAEDTPINITLAGSDPEGESLTYTILEVNNATVTLNGNVATYTPDAHFNGTDTFTYYANDGTSDSNIATVTMTVSAEDDEPNTLDVATTTDEDVAVAVNLSAEEYDGDSYSFAIITDVTNGTTSLNGSTVTYTPNQDFNGEDTFTFEATDDTGRTINVATATITVNAVNDAPVANDITNQVTDENRMMQLDITLDATDVDGDALTYSISSASNGTLSLNNDIVTYVPNQDWNGEDTFTYIANDGSVDSNTATVTITVNSVNDAPVTEDQSSTTDEDNAVDITLSASDVEGDNITFIVEDPNYGTTSLDGNILTYTPFENWHGEDSFTFKANDGSMDSNISTVTITVNAIDDLPIVFTESVGTYDEDINSINLNLRMIDVDGGNDHLTPKFENNQPPTGWSGNFNWKSFWVQQTASISSNYVKLNFKDSSQDTDLVLGFIYNAGAWKNISLNNSDSDWDQFDTSGLSARESMIQNVIDHLSLLPWIDTNSEFVTFFNSNSGPNVTKFAQFVLLLNPDQNLNGAHSIGYYARDGITQNNSDTGYINLDITPINDAPIANDKTVSTNETRFISLDITLEATDVDGDDLIYSLESNPSNGTATLTQVDISSEAVVSYVPTTDWSGEDSFTFKANDGSLDSNTATVSITVNAVDDAPVVVDSTFVIDEDQVIDFVLSATDVDDEDLFGWAAMTDPSNGTVQILNMNTGYSATKTYRYTPNTNYNGTDSFKYYATNQNAQISNTATISFTINPVNDGPIANNLDMTVDEDSSGSTIAIKGDDNGATDPEGDAITYYIVDAPSNGSIYNDAGGGQPDGDALAAGDELTSFFTIYNPNANYNGVDTFTFKGSDGTLDGNTATVQITVSPVNDAPVAEDKSVLMDEDWQGDGTQYYPMKLIASDIDNTSLTFSVVSNPTNGNIGNGFYTNAGSGANADSIAYKPNANWNGTDTFTYKVNDGTDDSNTATVTITVNPVNDAPVTQNVSFSTNEDTPYTESYTSYVNDVEGDNLTITTVTDPTNGNATCDNATNCTYTPNQNYYGTDSFTYKVNDGEFDSNISTVSVTINSVNDAPNCSSVHNVSTNEDESLVINLPCTDIESDALTTVFLSNYKTPQNGTLNVDGITITYTPNANYEGLDSFEYHVYDGTNQSGVEVVNITVNSVNDAPVASAVSTSTAKNTAKTITLSATDVDTGSLTYSIVSNPSNGSLGSVNGATVTYTPDNNWSGTDTFTYKANDGNSDGNTATVTVKVVSNSKSLDFDGDDLVYMSGSTGVFTSAMTVQAWAKADALQSNKYIVSKGKNTDNTFRAYGLKAPYTSSEVDNNGNSGKWLGEMNVGGTEYYISSSTDAVLNEWAHLLMTYDGSNIKLYVNGQLEGTQSASGNIGGNNSSGVRFAVGSLEINDSRYRFDGTIDEVAIWNDALSLSDINTLYNGGKGTNAYDVRTSDLSGYWNFDGNTNDLSSNGNNGSFQEGSGSDDFEPTYVDDSPEI